MCHSARYFTNITLSSQTHTKMSASIVILKKSKRVQKQDLLLGCCTLRWGSWDVNSMLCSSIKMSSKEVSIVGPGFQLDPFLSNSKAPKCVWVCACIWSERKIHQDFVHEPFIDQVWGCPVHSRNGISNGTVWFSELTSLSKATSLVPLEIGYTAQ